jgi:membrane-bound serine protease (ClpP class)
MIVLVLWLVGVACLAVELFTPGMIVGAIGITSLAASVGLCFHEYGPLAGTALGGGSLLVATALIKVGISRLSLKTPLTTQAGFVGTDDHTALIGQTGAASTTLRPGGYATIAGKRVDVVTQGDHLPAGTVIEVMAVEGNRIVVRKKAGAA